MQGVLNRGDGVEVAVLWHWFWRGVETGGWCWQKIVVVVKVSEGGGGLFFRIAVTWQRMQWLLFVLLSLVVVLETLSNSFKTLHQNWASEYISGGRLTIKVTVRVVNKVKKVWRQPCSAIWLIFDWWNSSFLHTSINSQINIFINLFCLGTVPVFSSLFIVSSSIQQATKLHPIEFMHNWPRIQQLQIVSLFSIKYSTDVLLCLTSDRNV